MDLSSYRHRETVTIDCPAEQLYDLISDVTQMDRWSPVSQGADLDPDDPTWFVGRNGRPGAEWATRCQIVVADPGREFAFVNHGMDGKHALVRWGYTFTPVDGGTEVAETWEVLPTYEAAFAEMGPEAGELPQLLDFLRGMAEESMPATLANLKAAAESSAPT